jgi:hypothetical protein
MKKVEPYSEHTQTCHPAIPHAKVWDQSTAAVRARKSPYAFKLMPEGWLNANESATDICAKAGAIVGPRMNSQETGE